MGPFLQGSNALISMTMLDLVSYSAGSCAPGSSMPLASGGSVAKEHEASGTGGSCAEKNISDAR